MHLLTGRTARLAGGLALAWGMAGAAGAAPAAAHGATIQVVPHGATVATNQSNNWSGYNQGLLEKGHRFTEVSATWTVPTARQHRSGEAEFSSTWVGIGGGCVDKGCTVTDSTLVQAGTEQDVDASGTPSYSAWWEVIPAPSIQVSLPVTAGQVVHVDVAQTLPEVWRITIANRSTGRTFTTTVPYASSYATAEWILETPLVVGGGSGGFSAMPSLSTVVFDPGTVNGGSPRLVPSEAIQLVDTGGHVLATPSSPDSDADGFADCTYATGCATNAS